MKHSNRITLSLLVSLSLVACGGGGGGDAGSAGGGASATTPAAASTQIDNTADIVASRDFSFDVGRSSRLPWTITDPVMGPFISIQKQPLPAIVERS